MADEPLPRSFYGREPVQVARDLIGAHLVRIVEGDELVGRIVETEAYRGRHDPASHAYRGRTARNRPMFGEPGHAYVYFIYGMHWMFNIAAHPTDAPGAVLIRALEPLKGLDRMRRNRSVDDERELTSGPAKLAQALAINGELNDVDLCTSEIITLRAGSTGADIKLVSGPRIRVPGDSAAQQAQWRFWIQDSPYVSE